jgi:hypothetical protein
MYGSELLSRLGVRVRTSSAFLFEIAAEAVSTVMPARDKLRPPAAARIAAFGDARQIATDVINCLSIASMAYGVMNRSAASGTGTPIYLSLAGCHDGLPGPAPGFGDGVNLLVGLAGLFSARPSPDFA